MNLAEILNKSTLTREEIVFLLRLTSPGDINLLLEKADSLRNEVLGKEIKMIGNINFSNHCEENCKFCPERSDNASLKRFRFTAEKIIEAIKSCSNMGLNEVILRSGRDSHFDSDMISYIIFSVKKKSDISVTLSLCERDFHEYRRWNISGAERYILKHISANPSLFSVYHNGNNLNRRIDHLRHLRELGFKTGTGSIIGLPNQQIEDIADDILLSKELGVEMLILNSFNQMDYSLYQNRAGLSYKLVLKAIAAARLAINNIDIPVYSSLVSRELPLKERMLHGGANVLITNFDAAGKLLDNFLVNAKMKSTSEITSYQNNPNRFIKDI